MDKDIGDDWERYKTLVAKHYPEYYHTLVWDDHPEDYDGPCFCTVCRSYMAEEGGGKE